MKSFRLQGDGVGVLIRDLAGLFANETSKTWTSGGSSFHLIVGSKYFFRTSTTVSLVIVAHQSSGSEADVLVFASGGSTGLWGITWGAHEAYENEFERALMSRAQARGIVVEAVPREVREMLKAEAPPKARYTCYNCGSTLKDPLAECSVCGAKMSRPREAPEEVRCSHCGMRTPTDKGECYYCGHRLGRGR